MKLSCVQLLLPLFLLATIETRGIGDIAESKRSRPSLRHRKSSSEPESVNDLVDPQARSPFPLRDDEEPYVSRPRPGRKTLPEVDLMMVHNKNDSHRDILKSSKDALFVTKKIYLKKDWCKTEPLILKIREPGCISRTIQNSFCYGQCNSFYIPKNARQDMELTAFKSCSFCKPKRFTWITITLSCPSLNPPYKKKKIQRVKQCKCMAEILQ